MDFLKYKKSLKNYLSMKGYKDFEKMICCPFHEDKNPSMKVYDESAKCFSSCGTKDIFDFVELFECIGDKKDQYNFVANLFGFDINVDMNETTNKFQIDPEACQIVVNYILDHKKNDNGYINYFIKKRGYEKSKIDIAKYLGYWPGYEKAFNDLGDTVLNAAGIPLPKDGIRSSWNHAGVVFIYESGFKLMYIGKKDGKEQTIKRGSYGSLAFPYPGLPEGKSVVLVESEIGSIVCIESGFKNVVGLGGLQGLTKESIEKLKIYDEIILMMDSDIAGKKAVGLIPFDEKEKNRTTIIAKLKKNGFSGRIKICILPDNVDPDDLIRDGKFEVIKTCLEKSISVTEEKKLDPDDDLSNAQLMEMLEPLFNVENWSNHSNLRSEKESLQRLFTIRPELMYQESARLYFEKIQKNGIKIHNSGNGNTIWIYDELKKYWSPMIDRINHEPMEIFIERYGAIYFYENKRSKSKKINSYHFRKNIKTRSEIEKHFLEYVRYNIVGEDDPFEKSKAKKIISCKNCVLVWNFEKNKFEEEAHSNKHNLTVSPFPFNRLNTKKLTDDQEKRKEAIRKYIYALVEWVDRDYNDKDLANIEKDKIIQFLLSYIGYTLTPWREKCFHIWIGTQDSGKSTLKEILQLLHGNKFVEADFNQWSSKSGPHDKEVLPGRLVVADDDFEVGGKLPERELKTLSQNGTVTINPKHVAQYTITNTATPLILTNGYPRAEDLTLNNRLYAVPFEANFSRENRTPDNEKFINYIKEHETLEVLFNIAIDISETTIFKYGNFSVFAPECVQKSTTIIIQNASAILVWLEDMKSLKKLYIARENKNIKISRKDLFDLYCMTSGNKKKSATSFYENIRQIFKPYRSNGIDYFLGIEKLVDRVDKLSYNDDNDE